MFTKKTTIEIEIRIMIETIPHRAGMVIILHFTHFVKCVRFVFFQAEDGIRDVAVTGVQTCALPISFFGEKSSTEVIGVVPTGRYRTLAEDPVPVVFRPQLWARRALVVRTSGDPATLLDSIRSEIHSVDPTIAPTDLETMQQYMSLPLFPARATGLLLGVSGFLALVLTRSEEHT